MKKELQAMKGDNSEETFELDELLKSRGREWDITEPAENIDLLPQPSGEVENLSRIQVEKTRGFIQKLVAITCCGTFCFTILFGAIMGDWTATGKAGGVIVLLLAFLSSQNFYRK